MSPLFGESLPRYDHSVATAGAGAVGPQMGARLTRASLRYARLVADGGVGGAVASPVISAPEAVWVQEVRRQHQRLPWLLQPD